MADVMDMLSDITAATLQPTVDRFAAEYSPIVGSVMKSSSGVWMNPQIGKDWKVTRSIELGKGGAAEMGSMGGPETFGVGSAKGFNVYQQVDTWPGLGEAVSPAYINKELTLKRMKVVMYVPHIVMRLAQMKAHIGQHMRATIRGTARTINSLRSNNFLGDSKNTMGKFTGVTGDGLSISSAGQVITLNAGSSIARFGDGDRVDIYDTTTYDRINTEPIFVGNVDGFGTSASPVEDGGGTLKLYHVGSSTTTIVNASVYDIVPRNCGRELGSTAHAARKTTCLDDIIVDSGSVYGISVDDVPQLKSMVRTLSDATLTGGNLLKYVTHYQHVRPGMDGITALWAQPGVWAAYFNALGAEFSIERNGQIVSVKDGFAKEASYSLGGFNLPFKWDPWLPENTVFGLNLENNWTLIVPPKIPGTGSESAIDGAFEFLWPLSGGKGIFTNYRQVGGAEAGAFTDMMVAPGEHIFEFAAEKIPGLKITDVASLYG